MKRTVIKIDEERCNGCGQCITGCHEGALQLIEGKARLVSELFCDGLGACIGECPVGAIELEEREAEPYSEIAVMQRIAEKGEVTILAHLRHLKEHGETGYLQEGVQYIKQHGLKVDLSSIKRNPTPTMMQAHGQHQGCPGSKSFAFVGIEAKTVQGETSSQLRQWPVQLHLLNPNASYFQGADVLLAADCAAFAAGNFHSAYLKNKILAIACPKLDSGKESYIEKITAMINESNINTLTVVRMEVPCCGGLTQIAQLALQEATRKIPVKEIVLNVQGETVSDKWV